MNIPFSILLLFTVVLAAIAGEPEGVTAPHPPSETLGKYELKPLSTTKLRLKSAADHLTYGVGYGAFNTAVGPALMVKAGVKGSKYAAQKVKMHWQDGSYHKAAGHTVMIAARPASSLVTAPAAMVAGIGSAAVGTVRAAGSMLKLAKDASSRPFRAKEEPEQKLARQLQNAEKLNRKTHSKRMQYGYPPYIESEAYKAIAGEPLHF